jgi:hypothetical protein
VGTIGNPGLVIDPSRTALVNFRFLAHALWTTDVTVEKLAAVRR